MKKRVLFLMERLVRITAIGLLLTIWIPSLFSSACDKAPFEDALCGTPESPGSTGACSINHSLRIPSGPLNYLNCLATFLNKRDGREKAASALLTGMWAWSTRKACTDCPDGQAGSHR